MVMIEFIFLQKQVSRIISISDNIKIISNDVKNIAILGRIPFVGVKDIITNEELGTTVDSKILSGITGEAGFKVYYSANGEATKDFFATD